MREHWALYFQLFPLDILMLGNDFLVAISRILGKRRGHNYGR